MKEAPLVTVICLCYNHSRFVEEALQSVIDQSYGQVQLIVVDDASTDNSAIIIEAFCARYSEVQFIANETNQGNCKSFNQALNYAKGDYFIDLAADDVLEPERITAGIKTFEKSDSQYGVNFCNAEYINKNGDHLKYFYASDKDRSTVPHGDVFTTLIERYALCSPTTMFRREVIDQLGGYDEQLAYEDFDFWVHSSRNWKYCYTDEVLVKKRVVEDSHGSKQYQRKSQQRFSTYLVCRKVYQLCQSKKEYKVLRKRIKYELKHSLWHYNLLLTFRYLILWLKAIR